MTHPRRRQVSRAALMVRAVRTRSWPRFMLAGALLAAAGVALLGGVAQAAVAFLGLMVFLFAAVRGLDSDDYYRREPPVTPGGTGRV